MNLIAGILIGFFNESWLLRIVIPFIWGVVFCVYVSIVGKNRRNAYIEKHADSERRFGMSVIQSFYFVEYMTAITTSLLFSIISGFVRTFIWK